MAMFSATMTPATSPVARIVDGRAATASTTESVEERDRELGDSRHGGAVRARQGEHMIHRGVGRQRAEDCRGNPRARDGAGALRRHVGRGVTSGDAAQREERECHRRVHVGARPGAERRVDERGGRGAHREPHQHPPHDRVGQVISARATLDARAAP